MAALARWAKEDPHAAATRAQSGLRSRFEREARAHDPAASEPEIARRAACAYRRHMIELSRLAAAARTAKRRMREPVTP